MREALFLKQNQDRWKQYERESTTDPDELAARFIQLTDDLAFAKTFYPRSKTVAYLNGLTSQFHLAIYKNRKEQSNRLVHFWKTELPLILYRYQPELFYSFAIFMVFFLMGWLSARYDDKFIRLILSDGYVDMTKENIRKGDPFGVYKSQSPGVMFVMIAFNNIMVSFYTYALGITACIGTIYLLFQNGLMLGSFEYLFYQEGLVGKSILVIFIHGTIEISAIIVAGTAGIVLGKSWLFPGTYTRSESLVRGGKDSLKIAAGLVPFFLIAAFFESYVTRHTGMPVLMSMCILFGSLVLIVWYFVLYPRVVARRVALPEMENAPSFEQKPEKPL
jgi:uncharacterized membrane protein SpoIIM required for sporulation